MADSKRVQIQLGRNIVMHREKLGLSQKLLAVKLGITQESLARMEKGVIAPRVARLEDIARELKCTMASLFREGEDVPDRDGERTAMLMEALHTLPGDIQEDVVRLIVGVARIR